MDKVQKRAVGILIDVLTTLEPRVKGLSAWMRSICETTEKWSASEGNQGVKRMKDILAKGLAIIFKEAPGDPISFCKADNGIPILAIPYIKCFEGKTQDTRLMSAAVTISRLPDLWLGKADIGSLTKSLETITESRIPGTASRWIKEFSSEFLPKFFAAYPDSNLVRAWKKSIPLTDSHKYLYRESKGPNGPLIACAHLDVLSLDASLCSTGNTLLEEVLNLGNLIGSLDAKSPEDGFRMDRQFVDLVLESRDSMENFSKSPGKLSVKAEKGGKARLVAMPDYLSQLVMKPLHEWLMSILRSIPSDATFDQRSAIPKISQWQNEGREISSFDQSSCTDLFPFDLQLSVIGNRFGIPVTESLRTVMADRDWILSMKDGTTRKVRWSVGQPLGMFGSWALMALTHHLLVHYCHWLSCGKRFSKKPFSRYVICGDDIVIADKQVSRYYQKVVSQLGMRINLSKSHVSGGNTGIPPVSEFAKVIIWKGKPLFPIRPNMVLRAAEDVRYAIPMIIDLVSSETWAARLGFVERMINKHFPREKRLLTSLLTIPQEFGGIGLRDDRSLRSTIMDQYDTRYIHPYVYWLALRVRAGLKKEQAQMRALGSSFERFDPPSSVIRKHPFTEFMRDWNLQMGNFRSSTASLIPSVLGIVATLLEGGIGEWIRFIRPGESEASLPRFGGFEPFSRDRSDREEILKRTAWMASLLKTHSYPKQRKFTRSPSVEEFLLSREEVNQTILASLSAEERLQRTEALLQTAFQVRGSI